MLQRSKQSLLVGLTAGLLLAAAGAYAISLNGIRQPTAGDLPVIAVTRLVDAAIPTPPAADSVTPTSTAPVREPTPPVASSAAERVTPHREVVTPDVREEDDDDHDSDDDHESHESSSAAKTHDGESSTQEKSAEHDD